MSFQNAQLGDATLTDVGYQFFSSAEVAIGSRVTSDARNDGDGWYSADVTIPRAAASIRWSSLLTPAAIARWYFDWNPTPRSPWNFDLVVSDDYYLADGRALQRSDITWPDLTGATVKMRIGGLLEITGTVTTAQSVRFELTAAQTALLTTADSYDMDVQAVLATTSHAVRLASGTVTMQTKLPAL